MSISTKDKKKLKKLVKELSEYSGRHTELVTVYVPAGYDLVKVIHQLMEEQGTAENIKSAGTRKNVIAALERMIQHLKIIGKTPEHGLACFSGNVSEREGKQDVRVWSIEPPQPINLKIYRCDKKFVIEPIEEMLETKDIYGLVVMDRREGTLALLKGKRIVPLSYASSNVPGKTRAGGQSAHRFERLREGAALEFYKKIADMMKKEFLQMKDLKGIILGGPGHTKYEFLDTAQITEDVKKKIIAIKDVSYTDESGLTELLEKSQDVLAQEEVSAEKEVMNRFFKMLAEEPGKVAYGEAEVRKAIEFGAVEILLLSEELEDEKSDELEEKASAT
ncbi:peptide chain release factor aRF-1, partial [Candidatus Woesearchaeota archaeon]|nr:peptide chain release factor aRF-1 [Candidatus Woesearchaeota archaeon]